MKIILASNSPRRREILETLGIKFEVIVPQVDENIGILPPHEFVETLAQLKGYEGFKAVGSDEAVVISADTIVYCGGRILGKPHDKAEAMKMLKLISGKIHTVYSSVALTDKDGSSYAVSSTDVFFDEIPEDALCAYLDTPEPYDKAGGYGIQGWAAQYIKHYEGNFFDVMGLPVGLLYSLFKERYGRDL